MNTVPTHLHHFLCDDAADGGGHGVEVAGADLGEGGEQLLVHGDLAVRVVDLLGQGDKDLGVGLQG